MSAQVSFTLLAIAICIFCFYVSKFLTLWIFLQSQKWMIVDDPAIDSDRKFQDKPIPLLGGLSFVFVCGLATSLVWLIQKNNYLGLQNYLAQNLDYSFKILWILIGGLILMVGGILDDIYTFSTKRLFLWIFVGIWVAVFLGGLSINSFSFPFDKILPHNIFLGSFLAFVWIGLCISATKFLDGHDGLVGLVGVLNFFVIALVANFTNINQPLIVILALIWASGILGFLPYNVPNAKIYLGESASEVVGFVIGVLSILSGAKIATTTGIIGWFIFDLLLVIYLRKKSGKSIFAAGREHWHFRLLDSGLDKWQVLYVTLSILFVSSIFSLTLPTDYKLYSILGQFVILIIIFAITDRIKKKS